MSNEYPRDNELETIKNWDYKRGFKSLFEYIENIWRHPDWGFRIYRTTDHLLERKVMGVQLHTGGWSGNESIVSALGDNFMFWSQCFYKHKRGGHFWFQIRKELWTGKWE